MAMGPDGGVSPPDGLKVQGYLETDPVDLSADHGLDTEQKIVAWVSRPFRVGREGPHLLSAVLDGIVNFEDFYFSTNHQAFYNVGGNVSLEKIIDDGPPQMMPGFPISLSPANANVRETFFLRPQNESQQTVSYRLKIILTLQSNIVNFTQVEGAEEVHGVIDGSYQLGTQSQPFTLQATVSEKRVVAPWLNLLLLDG
jgi:hypothetical protein